MRFDVIRMPNVVRRRSGQLRRIIADDGLLPLGARMLTRAAWHLNPGGVESEVRPEDVLAADLSRVRPVVIPAVPPNGRLVVNFVTTPPSSGSGGHTTLFRLIRYLEAMGHTCRIYLYDVYGTHARYHVEALRSAASEIQAEVGGVLDGMADAHAVFATAWSTAYPVFNDPCAGRRFYLVQDYEPWFFPVGATSTLAENTYRMGFHAFAAGRFLAEKLKLEFNMAADWFDFGCDTAVYRLDPSSRRAGVVFYARPSTPRRAYALGIASLQLFAERHPHIDIHLYGDKVGKLGPRFFDHGRMTPGQLSDLYNRCWAALSLSMTNVSLVPHEMLAAGCIPVVNDADHNRLVLDNEYVVYASPTPHALANALHSVVTRPDFATHAAAASASVARRSWDDAGAALDQMLRRALPAGADAAGTRLGRAAQNPD